MITDYKAYREHVGISNPDMTKTLREEYPSFTRIDANFVNHPLQHGVCLLPEAEVLLVNKFGPGPGLHSLVFDEAVLTGEVKKPRNENRKRKNRVTFRLDDAELEKAEDLREAYGAMTWQELFEKLLRDAHKRWEEDDS